MADPDHEPTAPPQPPVPAPASETPSEIVQLEIGALEASLPPEQPAPHPSGGGEE